MFVRRFLLATIVIALTVLLTGCYRLQGQATVATNGTLSGTFTVAFPKKIYAQVKTKLPQTNLPTGVSVAPYSKANYRGSVYTLTNVKDSDLRGAHLPLTLNVVDGMFVLRGDFSSYNITKATLKNTGIRVRGPVPTPDVNLSFTFPGSVETASSGVQVSGNVATVDATVLSNDGTFAVQASGATIVGGAGFANRPHRKIDEQTYYPLVVHQRSTWPLYLFTLLIMGGGTFAIFGRYYRRRIRAPKES